MKNFKTFLLEDIDSDVLLKRIVADIDELKEKYITIKLKRYSLFLNDFFLEEHYDEYMTWAQKNFSELEIDQDKHVAESAFRKFMFENEDLINNWLLEDDDFIDWAEDEVMDDDGREDPMDAFKRKRDE